MRSTAFQLTCERAQQPSNSAARNRSCWFLAAEHRPGAPSPTRILHCQPLCTRVRASRQEKLLLEAIPLDPSQLALSSLGSSLPCPLSVSRLSLSLSYLPLSLPSPASSSAHRLHTLSLFPLPAHAASLLSLSSLSSSASLPPLSFSSALSLPSSASADVFSLFPPLACLPPYSPSLLPSPPSIPRLSHLRQAPLSPIFPIFGQLLSPSRLHPAPLSPPSLPSQAPDSGERSSPAHLLSSLLSLSLFTPLSLLSLPSLSPISSQRRPPPSLSTDTSPSPVSDQHLGSLSPPAPLLSPASSPLSPISPVTSTQLRRAADTCSLSPVFGQQQRSLSLSSLLSRLHPNDASPCHLAFN